MKESLIKRDSKYLYAKPKVELIKFELADIIKTSGCDSDGCNEHSGCTGDRSNLLKLFN